MKAYGEILRILRKQKPLLGSRYSVSYIGVFGSYARGTQKKGSDIDILVDFSGPIGLFAFMQLESYLSNILGIKADLVMKTALKPHIGKLIIKEVVPA
ncbi:MAG: nucleotidyltransferase family protein [Candidatus Aenigmarchaeota archaeon]|nr:nucleotidyltransferase family protein [Candidatus Aenigmarchaeota archaeon]